MKVKSALSNKTGEGYIDTAVKMIIAVVLGSLLLVGLENLDYYSRFVSLFKCAWDKIDCALMTFGNYGQQERNKWRYQYASKGMQA